MAIRLATGANALDTADAVKAQASTELEPFFPPGMKVVYPVRHHAVRAHCRSRRW